MQPFNSAIHTERSTGTSSRPPGNYVFLGDFRICRYDPHEGVLYFKGQLMKNVEYAVRIEDFLKAVEAPPEVVFDHRPKVTLKNTGWSMGY